MTLSVSTINLVVVALMPVLVSLVAGFARQNGLSESTNHGITMVIAVIVAIGQALLNGKLGGSPMADFTIVMAYTTAVIHTPLFQQFQTMVQSNTSVYNGPPPTDLQPPPPPKPITLGP